MEMPPAGPPLLQPTQLTTSTAMPAPGDFIGRYLLLCKMDAGDSSCVFLAHDPLLDRSVAIKLLMTPDHASVELFRYAAQALAHTPHPHIVTLHDYLHTAYGPALVLEYLVGRSLAQWLTERGRLSVTEAVKVFDPILSALEQLHRVGVTHGNLTPEHIFITTDHRIKLLGFGHARRADQTAAHVADDLYMLGTCLGTAVLNRTGDAKKDLDKESPDLRGAAPALRRILARATDANPRRRFHSVRALRQALAEAAGTRPAGAWRPLLGRLLHPPFLRWRPVGVELILILALAGLILGLGLYPRERPSADAGVQKKSARPEVSAPAASSPTKPAPNPPSQDRYGDLRQAWGSHGI